MACPHIWEDNESLNPDILVVRGKIIGTINWLCPLDFQGNYYFNGLKGFLQLDEHLFYTKRIDGNTQHLVQNTVACVVRTIDGAFGYEQPLTDLPEEIIQTCNNEKRIEIDHAKEMASGNLSP